MQNRIKKLVDTEKTLNDRITTFFDSYIESIRQYKKQLSKKHNFNNTKLN